MSFRLSALCFRLCALGFPLYFCAEQNKNTLWLILRNSLTIPHEAAENLIKEGAPHVIRIKMPKDEQVHFTDMIRGDVSFSSNDVDDKVLLKADGMPTYHLAVVVDDYLMKITHAFRGEEWLPSAPIHILLWKYLGWAADMPQWAHLPLILKPNGNGKLSKRDGEKFGFPVYPINWIDAASSNKSDGFLDVGFLPEGFINMLAMLGWNDGTEQEIFSIDELIEKFSLERIHKGGAKFDYEKAKWFNHEWIKRSSAERLLNPVKEALHNAHINDFSDEQLLSVIDLVKERCVLLTDFVEQASFFFKAPAQYDTNSVKPKWNEDKEAFFNTFADELKAGEFSDSASLEAKFKDLANEKGFKVGDVMLPFRVMLVGGKFGPQVFDIAHQIGKEETMHRIYEALKAFK